MDTCSAGVSFRWPPILSVSALKMSMRIRLILFIFLVITSVIGQSVLSSVSLAQAPPPRAQSGNSGREFIMSCTYGVLAGTIVGAAMLAFTDKPGDNLNRVARGASLGLYAGIALGLYVVYGVPDEDDELDLYNSPQVGFIPTETLFSARSHDLRLDGGLATISWSF